MHYPFGSWTPRRITEPSVNTMERVSPDGYVQRVVTGQSPGLAILVRPLHNDRILPPRPISTGEEHTFDLGNFGSANGRHWRGMVVRLEIDPLENATIIAVEGAWVRPVQQPLNGNIGVTGVGGRSLVDRIRMGDNWSTDDGELPIPDDTDLDIEDVLETLSVLFEGEGRGVEVTLPNTFLKVQVIRGEGNDIILRDRVSELARFSLSDFIQALQSSSEQATTKGDTTPAAEAPPRRQFDI